MVAKFHERFEIEVGVQEARRRFAARVANLIFEQLFTYHLSERSSSAKQHVASILGDRYTPNFLTTLVGTAGLSPPPRGRWMVDSVT